MPRHCHARFAAVLCGLAGLATVFAAPPAPVPARGNNPAPAGGRITVNIAGQSERARPPSGDPLTQNAVVHVTGTVGGGFTVDFTFMGVENFERGMNVGLVEIGGVSYPANVLITGTVR